MGAPDRVNDTVGQRASPTPTPGTGAHFPHARPRCATAGEPAEGPGPGAALSRRRAPRLASGRARALGLASPGTTAAKRLRRVDRWLLAVHAAALTQPAAVPLVVDLGYGCSPVTTVELFTRLRALRPGARVVGLEQDPARVAAAGTASRDGLAFACGGFELAGLRPNVARAMNVLRQYDEPAAARAWSAMCAALGPGGLLVEGSCDDRGRQAVWVVLDASGPRSLVLATHPSSLRRPSALADVLPRALAERNVPGQPVHALLTAFDDAWARAASSSSWPSASGGARQRFVSACAALDWPQSGPARHHYGELCVPWASVAPT